MFEIFVDLFFGSNKLIFRALSKHCFVSILVRRQNGYLKIVQRVGRGSNP